jgi:hypothetical protein
MISNPCYQCPDRRIFVENGKTKTCHSECKKHKDYTEAQKKKTAAVLSGREKYNIGAKYEIDRADKIRRKRGK